MTTIAMSTTPTSAAGSNVLSVRDLHVRLPHRAGIVHAVRGISFDIARGETVCIVGESGCGKSMTAMAILNLLPRGAKRQAGAIGFLGEDIANAGERRMSDIRGDRIGMIFQEPLTALNPSLTIGEQLMEVFRRHRPQQKREAHARAVDMLAQVGIPDPRERMTQYPHQLSGGLRQRVVIAMALMCEPTLIIADEPTTALDVTIQAQILRLLIDLKDRFGLALLLITHDLAVASRVADRIVVMYAGEVVEEAPTLAFFADPLHPYARGLMGCLPSARSGASGALLQIIPGTVPSLVGDLRGCAFRERCGEAESTCCSDVPLRANATRSVRCIHRSLQEAAA
jgi:peptide/nickel transport system ATP-binding protein